MTPSARFRKLHRLSAMEPTQILFALATPERKALGNFWRITTKGKNFYLDFVGNHAAGVHLSAHGPQGKFQKHRFHVKANKQEISTARAAGNLVASGLPRKGYEFDGQQIAPNAFLVARIRCTWDLQRPRFRTAALSRFIPPLTENQTGRIQTEPLLPNQSWDIDVVISFKKPHWPDPDNSPLGDAQLGPLQNDAGMWLTATSYHRWQTTDPTPIHLAQPLPEQHQTPSRLTAMGPGDEGQKGMFWLIEGITALERLNELSETLPQ